MAVQGVVQVPHPHQHHHAALPVDYPAAAVWCRTVLLRCVWVVGAALLVDTPARSLTHPCAMLHVGLRATTILTRSLVQSSGAGESARAVAAEERRNKWEAHKQWILKHYTVGGTVRVTAVCNKHTHMHMHEC